MLTSGRNVTAETAFAITLNSLFNAGKDLSPEQRDHIWKVCHESSDIQWATTKYLASSSSYAPTALAKLRDMLGQIFRVGEF